VALVGLSVNRYTTLASRVAKAAPCQGSATADVLRCYLELACQGKSAFEAICPFWADDEFFTAALGVQNVPSPETLRQRKDRVAEAMRPIVNFYTVELLNKAKPALSSSHRATCR